MATSREAELTELAARLRLAITRTARRMRQEAGEGLSPTLTAALATIERHGPLTPSELAALERVKRPSATRIIGQLAEGGLVTKAPDPSDGRSCLVSASAEGKALLRRVRRRKNAYISRRLRELDPSDLAALERAAEILEQMLEGDAG
jgi:DNA-binding MarR family transcriptional regulator